VYLSSAQGRRHFLRQLSSFPQFPGNSPPQQIFLVFSMADIFFISKKFKFFVEQQEVLNFLRRNLPNNPSDSAEILIQPFGENFRNTSFLNKWKKRFF
jgi:hypothetical protein